VDRHLRHGLTTPRIPECDPEPGLQTGPSRGVARGQASLHPEHDQFCPVRVPSGANGTLPSRRAHARGDTALPRLLPDDSATGKAIAFGAVRSRQRDRDRSCHRGRPEPIRTASKGKS
jgi:hypothetical protein